MDGVLLYRRFRSSKIGDLKISFSIIKRSYEFYWQTVADKLQTYSTQNGTIDLIAQGSVSADDMFQAAEEENKFITWALRIFSFFLMWCGLSAVLRPLAVAGSVIPFVEVSLVRLAALALQLFAFILTTATIAIAWITVRPIVAIPLLVVAAGLACAAYMKSKRKTEVAVAQTS